nr:hypothetical protein [Fusarium oxysporum]
MSIACALARLRACAPIIFLLFYELAPSFYYYKYDARLLLLVRYRFFKKV